MVRDCSTVPSRPRRDSVMSLRAQVEAQQKVNAQAQARNERLAAEVRDLQLSDPLAGRQHPVWRCVWRDTQRLAAHD